MYSINLKMLVSSRLDSRGGNKAVSVEKGKVNWISIIILTYKLSDPARRLERG